MPAKPFRILSLSGGGVRGIFQAAYLGRIAKELGELIPNQFDLMAGTSTGAINAIGIGLGIDPDRLLDFYQNRGGEVFRPKFLPGLRRGPRYRTTPLRRQLEILFASKQLGDCHPPVLVTATSLDRFDHRVFSSLPGSVSTDRELAASDVALASSAAPTYFAPVTPKGHQRAFVDGGLWANSPVAIAVLLAHAWLNVPFKDMRVVSIGTGKFPSGATPRQLLARRPLSPAAIRMLLELMFSAQESAADEQAEKLVGEYNFLRVNTTLNRIIALDDVTAAIAHLPSLGHSEAESTVARVAELIGRSSSLRRGEVRTGGGAVRPGLTDDHHFVEVELGLRIAAMETEWFIRRTAKLICDVDSLQELPFGVQLTRNENATRWDVTPSPQHLGQVVDEPLAQPGWKRYRLRFNLPLARGEEREFVLLGRVTFSEAPRRTWGWCSGYRVERLLLRVVFPDPPPPEIKYRVWDASHRTLHEEILIPDPITLECRAPEGPAEPNLRHAIVW